MAVSLQERANLVGDQTFQDRCLMARGNIAVKMLTASEGEYSDQHIRYANTVLMRPLESPTRVSLAVATDDTIAEAEVSGTGAADADIEARVEAAWLYLK